MSSASQSNTGNITCPRCGTKNSATNAVCTSCAAPLGQKNTTVSDTQSSSETSDGITAVIALGIAAYGAWKLFKKSHSESQSKANEVPPPIQREMSLSRKQAPPTRKPQRPRPAPGEHVSGMVEGEIIGIRIPGQPGRYNNKMPNIVPMTYIGSVPIYDKSKDRAYIEPVPPTFKFMFMIDNYPSGPVTDDEWDSWKIADCDVLWMSESFLDATSSGDDIPTESTEYWNSIDDFLQDFRKAGWEPAGQGRHWYSIRLRKRYDRISGPLKWK